MSTNSDDRSGRRLPLSPPNIVLVLISLAAALVTGLLGNVAATGILLILGVGGLISALLARRAGASDWLRINAVEYRDERDRKLGVRGLAVAGVVGLVLSFVWIIAACLYAGFAGQTRLATGLEAIACLNAIILAIGWGWANTVAIRRS